MMSWDEIPRTEKRRRVLREQDNKCLCGISEWNGKPIGLEFHHADGNNTNDTRDNVSMLCPNCHSQTSTYRANNIVRRKRSGPNGLETIRRLRSKD
jgi:hypothetical protein